MSCGPIFPGEFDGTLSCVAPTPDAVGNRTCMGFPWMGSPPSCILVLMNTPGFLSSFGGNSGSGGRDW